MQKLSIIGSSRIVEEHIKVAQKVGFKIINIYSSRKNSKNAIDLSNKYKIKNQKNYKLFLEEIQSSNSNVLIAGRIGDNSKYLNDVLKFNRPIFIEKPVFTSFKHFDKYQRYQNKIFVGYNRIFYQNINMLKKLIKNEKNLEVVCNCPEKNTERVLTNSSHIIAILIYLFGNLKITFREKNKKSIFVRLQSSKGHRVNIFYNFNSINNFSINIFNKVINILMKPIEIIFIYNKLDKKKIGNNNFYDLKIDKKLNEFKSNKYKPGFLNQMLSFRNFCYGKKKNSVSLSFSKKVMKLCNEINK